MGGASFAPGMGGPGSGSGPPPQTPAGAQGATAPAGGPLPQWGVGPTTPAAPEEEQGDGNKRTILKWEQEEEMGDQATISCVLYVNMCHPDLKQKYPGTYKNNPFLRLDTLFIPFHFIRIKNLEKIY